MILTGANLTFSSLIQTANYINELLERGNYTKLDDFLLSVKTEEYDYNSLMAIQSRFFKEFHMTPKQILKRVKREGAINFAKRRLNRANMNNAGMA